MTQILTDLVEAFETYPREYLTLDIVQVTPPGNAINVNEDVTFRIQVTNSGPLGVTDLRLLVEGLNGTLVKGQGAAEQFQASFTHTNQAFAVVPAHSAATPIVSSGSVFHFKPSRPWQTAKELVTVSVDGWEGSLSHIENSHSRADALAKDTYSAVVAPA